MSRGDWLRGAMDVLVQHGVAGVRVKGLARELGVTTGSFYWHFRNRDELLVTLLADWSASRIAALTEPIDAVDHDPFARLRAMMTRLASRLDGRQDIAMRAWALADARARTIVDEVDRRRLDAVRAVFALMGFEGDDLDARARLCCADHLAADAMPCERPGTCRGACLERRLRVLCEPGSVSADRV